MVSWFMFALNCNFIEFSYIFIFCVVMGNHSETSTVVENQEFSLEHAKINNAVFKKTKDHEYFETTYPI